MSLFLPLVNYNQKMKPRIYTYKITFPHQKWWYWGVHKEHTFGEHYDGSPSTHREKWMQFEHEKQILEFFDDWDEARKVEKRLIDPDLNNPQCLNENSVGGFSMEALKKGGEKAGEIRGKVAVETGQIKTIATPESRRRGGETAGKIATESGQLASVRTLESSRKGGVSLSKQRWMCLVTGHISLPGPLSRYQTKRGIDTSLRTRVK